jgi:hypothetical protein
MEDSTAVVHFRSKPFFEFLLASGVRFEDAVAFLLSFCTPLWEFPREAHWIDKHFALKEETNEPTIHLFFPFYFLTGNLTRAARQCQAGQKMAGGGACWYILLVL